LSKRNTRVNKNTVPKSKIRKLEGEKNEYESLPNMRKQTRKRDIKINRRGNIKVLK